jgi:hypothetical protein
MTPIPSGKRATPVPIGTQPVSCRRRKTRPLTRPTVRPTRLSRDHGGKSAETAMARTEGAYCGGVTFHRKQYGQAVMRPAKGAGQRKTATSIKSDAPGRDRAEPNVRSACLPRSNKCTESAIAGLSFSRPVTFSAAGSHIGRDVVDASSVFTVSSPARFSPCRAQFGFHRVEQGTKREWFEQEWPRTAG